MDDIGDSRITKVLLSHIISRDSVMMELDITHPYVDILNSSILSFKAREIGEEKWEVEVIYCPKIELWKIYNDKNFKIDTLMMKYMNVDGETMRHQFVVTGISRGFNYNGIETVNFHIIYKCKLVHEQC